MKYLRRYCCVLLCFALLFTAFSLTASASTREPSPSIGIYETISVNGAYSSYVFWPGNNSIQSNTFTMSASATSQKWVITYAITNSNGNILITKGAKVDCSFFNFYYRPHVLGSSSYFYYKPDSVRYLLFFTDGSMKYVDDIQFYSTNHNTDQTLNFKGSFTPDKDVEKIEVICTKQITVSSSDSVRFHFGEMGDLGDKGYLMEVYRQDESVGLIQSIINWVKDIATKISNLPSTIWSLFKGAFDTINSALDTLKTTITNWFSDLFDSIIELPSTMWKKFENGLKSLFVPTDEQLHLMFEDMDNLMYDKFGALYEVTQIIYDNWDTVRDSGITGVIDIPKVTIPVGAGEEFSFGPFTVDIIPKGFEFFVDILKTAFGMIFTVTFINAMRKRYDEIMGVEQQ